MNPGGLTTLSWADNRVRIADFRVAGTVRDTVVLIELKVDDPQETRDIVRQLTEIRSTAARFDAERVDA